METFEFNHRWPCFQNLPMEEAEIKETNDTILEMSPSLYFMQRIHNWAEKFFEPSLACYYDGKDYFKKLKSWEVQDLFKKL